MRTTGRLRLRDRIKLRWRRRAKGAPQRIASLPAPRSPGTFEVLCRIDAYADYVAEVEAASAEEAAELASWGHGSYRWESSGTQECDARLYVTLDANGSEIEATEVRDF
jgi:hypothetical protein